MINVASRFGTTSSTLTIAHFDKPDSDFDSVQSSIQQNVFPALIGRVKRVAMARHNHAHARDARAGGGHGGDRPRQVLCSHCNVAQPLFRFPKSVQKKYEKRIQRGEDPATIKLICFRCCNDPPAASASASGSGGPGMDTRKDLKPKQTTVPERRGRCNKCWVDHPLTTAYFTKADTHINAVDRRVCFTCRREQALLEAVDNDADADYMDVGQDDTFRVIEKGDDDDHDDDYDDRQHGFPVLRIEDQDDHARAKAADAAKEYARLTTKHVNALRLARKRHLHRRFVPIQFYSRQLKRQRAREQLDALARMQPDQQEQRNAGWGAMRVIDDVKMHHSDVKPMLHFLDAIDPSQVVYTHAADFANPLAVDAAQQQHDNEVDDDFVPAWHLTEQQRLDRIRRFDAMDRLGHVAPANDFTRQQIEQIIDDDLIVRFQRITSGICDPTRTRPPSFQMTCLLRTLNELSARGPSSSSSSRASSDTKPIKRLRFADRDD